MGLDSAEAEDRSFKLGKVFKPATPINRTDLFLGRKRQIQDVIDAINQDGHHIILFGERGVGKTSLANMLFSKLQGGMPIMTPHINCAANDTFSAIWKRVFEEIKDKADAAKIELSKSISDLMTSFTQQFSDELSPDTARRVLSEVGRECLLVVIIDEFDTVESDDARQAMADTLKFLSDKNVPATVVLIGVSDDVETLIAQHQSTERCLVQVRMPRMSEPEISSIVTTCLRLAEMTIAADALNSISYMSKGLPHYAHLLGLHSGREALNSGELRVGKEHVMQGIHAAIEKVNASVQALYREAISSSQKDAQYREVLLACALAPTDEFGFFAPVDVRGPLSHINKSPTKIEAFARHLHAFSEDDRGPVLKRTARAKRRIRFRFINPLLQPYVLLKGIDSSLITDEDLRSATTRIDLPEDGMLF